MTWIELHTSLPDHPKTIACAAALKIDKDLMLGKLTRLWTWAIDNRESGIFSEGEEELIAEKMRWTKGEKALIEALCAVPFGENAGFLERIDGGYYLYNWDKYAGRIIQKRSANAERMREARAKNVQRTCNAQDAHNKNTCNQCAGATVPNQTVPNHCMVGGSQRAGEEIEETEQAINDLKTISEFYEENIGSINSIVYDTLNGYIKEGIETELIKEAIKETIIANATNKYKYLNGILANCSKEGTKTLQQWNDRKQSAAEAKAAAGSRGVNKTNNKNALYTGNEKGGLDE